MEQSLYIDLIQNDFVPYANRVVERLNGSLQTDPLNYRSRTMLTKEYTPDLKWGSLSISESVVAADRVALDSPIPLKARDAMGSASGDITKQAMQYALREQELTQLGILGRTPGRQPQLLQRLFNDTKRCIVGQWEALEYQFLMGLSTGVTLIPETNNVGTGIRVDYGYLSGNKFGVPVVWTNTSSTPFSDISSRLLAKARTDGNRIAVFMTDQATFDNISKTTEAKQLFAFSQGFVGSNIPTPTFDQINTMTRQRYGFVFDIVDRTVRFQKNGVNTNLVPWQSGILIGLTSNQVGRLVWGTLAEMEHQAKQVTYTTVDDFILLRKYHEITPSLAEFTDSQALVLPVIDGVDAIYQMDSLSVQA